MFFNFLIILNIFYFFIFIYCYLLLFIYYFILFDMYSGIIDVWFIDFLITRIICLFTVL